MKDLVFEKLYDWSKKPYQQYIKKNKPWAITEEQLLQYPNGSLGLSLGIFLNSNHFEIQEKLEDHDVIHILTNTGTSVIAEIGMQYYLFGNTKRSLYLYLVIVSGTLFYPTHISYFITQYKKGKRALPFHYLDFSKMLLTPIEIIQQTFKI